MDLYANVPIGVDVFKTKGAGLNFVHGGASLEECIIPLLEVKASKNSNKRPKVDLQLISTNNRITNYDVMLTFFQKENVSQDIKPHKYQFILLMEIIKFLVMLLFLLIKI